jgi:hypothetical protein
MQWKKFKSPNSMTRRVATLSSHIYLIEPNKYTNVPDKDWSACYAAGCISEDMLNTGLIPASLLTELVEEQGHIEELEIAIKEAIRDNAQDAFYKNGDPKPPYFTIKLGKNVTKEYLMKAWSNLQNGYD